MSKPQRPGSSRSHGQLRREPAQRFGGPREPHHLFGLHPVAAAMANPARRRHRLLATTNALRRLEAIGTATDVPIEEVDASRLSRLLGSEAVHQGCLLYCDPLAELALEDVASPQRLVMLDQVTDPHNVGAVLRSCAAFAVDALILTARHSPRETPVLAKSAAGALEIVPIVRVRNLGDSLLELSRADVMSVGLDAEAENRLEDVDLRQPFALVLGAEGSGLRQRTKQTCRTLARIEMPGRITSLNVSNAAALALYIADRAVG